jgi:hypothetical protein
LAMGRKFQGNARQGKLQAPTTMRGGTSNLQAPSTRETSNTKLQAPGKLQKRSFKTQRDPNLQGAGELEQPSAEQTPGLCGFSFLSSGQTWASWLTGCRRRRSPGRGATSRGKPGGRGPGGSGGQLLWSCRAVQGAASFLRERRFGYGDWPRVSSGPGRVWIWDGLSCKFEA